MKNAKTIFASLALALITIAVAGCGIKTVPVSGKVVVDGVPAENIRVVFQSDSTAQNVAPVAIGKTNKDGEFSLSLAKTKKKGAAPGNYAVFLVWQDPDAEENPIEGQTVANESPYKLPPRANSGEIRFEVPAKGTKEANFEFNSSEEKFDVPVGV
ncbi:MAG: hypothetical protein J6X44_10635 [Thermoguttaceae bacterium]|nr:hypothetical protein [Thermoguttaceae bacterium]